MKDQHGIFYYPAPANKKFKMYVRDNDGVIEFRLHNEEDQKMWEEHGWITYEMAKQAASMYNRKNGADPLSLYDFETALSVLKDQD